jgi:hypothetical protein
MNDISRNRSPSSIAVLPVALWKSGKSNGNRRAIGKHSVLGCLVNGYQQDMGCRRTVTISLKPLFCLCNRLPSTALPHHPFCRPPEKQPGNTILWFRDHIFAAGNGYASLCFWSCFCCWLARPGLPHLLVFSDDLDYRDLDRALEISLAHLRNLPATTRYTVAGELITVDRLIDTAMSFQQLIAQKPSTEQLNLLDSTAVYHCSH